jgi:hypothetical protein
VLARSVAKDALARKLTLSVMDIDFVETSCRPAVDLAGIPIQLGSRALAARSSSAPTAEWLRHADSFAPLQTF